MTLQVHGTGAPKSQVPCPPKGSLRLVPEALGPVQKYMSSGRAARWLVRPCARLLWCPLPCSLHCGAECGFMSAANCAGILVLILVRDQLTQRDSQPGRCQPS